MESDQDRESSVRHVVTCNGRPAEAPGHSHGPFQAPTHCPLYWRNPFSLAPATTAVLILGQKRRISSEQGITNPLSSNTLPDRTFLASSISITPRTTTSHVHAQERQHGFFFWLGKSAMALASTRDASVGSFTCLTGAPTRWCRNWRFPQPFSFQLGLFSPGIHCPCAPWLTIVTVTTLGNNLK